MIDIMWGDPALNSWEKKFVESVARQGWQRDYSDKQKAKIKSIFRLMKMVNRGDESKEKQVLPTPS